MYCGQNAPAAQIYPLTDRKISHNCVLPFCLRRCMYNRAILLERDGRLTEAEDMQRKCLQLRQRVLGEDHPQVQALNRAIARIVTKYAQTLQSAVALASLVASGGDVEEGMRTLQFCSEAWCAHAETSGCRHTLRTCRAGQVEEGAV